MKKTPLQGICLDGAYSNAFLGAAAATGHTTLDPKMAEVANESEQRGLIDFFTDKRSTGRLRPQVLEMAAIFERVHFFGIGYGLDIEKLKASSEDLVGIALHAGQHIEDSYSPDPEIVREIKPLIIRTAHRQFNHVLRHIGWSEFPYKAVSATYDALVSVFFYLDDVVAFQQYLDDVVSYLREPADGVDDPLLKPRVPQHYEFLASALKQVLAVYRPEKVPLDVMILCVLDTLRSITNSLQIMAVSANLDIPFLTRDLEIPANQGDPADVSEAFHLCQVCLTEEIEYAPAVEDIDDVLRIRHHPAIGHFRDLLWQWTIALRDGEEKAVMQIRKDIQKANRDLRRLGKWRKVDKWVFWVQIPGLFVPFLSSVLTVASMASQLHIERKEKTSTWIGIGR